MLVLLTLLASLPGGGADGAAASTTMYSIQHQAPHLHLEDDMTPPLELWVRMLTRDGPEDNTASQKFGQFLHIGCFDAPMSITMDSEQDVNFDPAECVEICKEKMPYTPAKDLVVAVHGMRCGCTPNFEIFQEVDAELCIYPCKYYENPICGGPQNYWGVFRQYQNQVLSGQGAYDPWRRIFYMVVTMNQQDFYTDKLDPDDFMPPERYYLHAVDVSSGKPAFNYHMRLPGLLHGVQYDLDSNRLVGVMTSDQVGRSIKTGQNWVYYLFTVFINGTNPLRPNMTWDADWKDFVIETNMAQSDNYLSFAGCSAIMSKNKQDVFIFVGGEAGPFLASTLHRIYFVDIPSGEIIYEKPLDFIVMQLFSNEQYGDVTAAGYRFGAQIYTELARVYYSPDEDAKKVDWRYNNLFPNYLVPSDSFKSVQLYHGTGASDHLYNKSYIWYRNWSNNYNDRRSPVEHPPLLLEVNIRSETYERWCNQEFCAGTIKYDVPYAAIFNREPKIPLTLAAPAMLFARFAMDGSPLYVEFDRTTLKGAKPVDTDGDVLPDIIDYFPRLSGQWDCAKVFDDETAILFGPYTEGIHCEWTSDSSIKVVLNYQKDLSVLELGDQIFLRPGVLYTTPKPATNEYSTDASGGIQVSLPNPLLDPLIVPTGTGSIVDFCSPFSMSAQDSQQDGARPTYEWSLTGYADMTNDPNREFNMTKIALIKDELQNATLYNHYEIKFPSAILEAGTTFNISLKLTSRWGRSANQTLNFTKVDYPAPMVSILGPTTKVTNRTQELSLLAQGQPSECNSESKKLLYRWTETSGKLDFDVDYPDIVRTSRSLIIPPFVLETSDDSLEEYNMYNFTVECFSEFSPDKASYATVRVLVQRSYVYVKLRKADRPQTIGNVLVIDARESQDTDDPQPETSTFKGSFEFFCLNPNREPCYDQPDVLRRLERVPAKGRDAQSGYGQLSSLQTTRFRRLTSSDGINPLSQLFGGPNYADIMTCKTTATDKIVDGGRTFSMPLFVGANYENFCQYARGVIMVDTSNLTSGEYLWTVRITAYSGGRQATTSFRVQITEYDVPSVSLSVLPDVTRYTVTSEIRIVGTIEDEIDPDIPVVYSWRIAIYQINPAYDIEKAQAAENDPSLSYIADKYAFIDLSAIYDISNQTEFYYDPNQPNLIIKANVLQSSSIYSIRLVMTVGDPQSASGVVEGYTEVRIETAGQPPMQGTLICLPANATMNTPRLLMAPNWVADSDSGLTYSYGYIKFLNGIGEAVRVPFNSAALPVQEMTVNQMPLGEPSTNYSLTIFVDVSTSDGARTTKEIQVQSAPPENVTEAISQLFEDAANAAPEDVQVKLTTILELNAAPTPAPGEPPVEPDPEDMVLFEKVLEIMDAASEQAPITEQGATQQAVVVSQVIDMGMKNARALDSLESLVQRGAANGLFSIANPTLMAACFHSIGSILPDTSRAAMLARAAANNALLNSLEGGGGSASGQPAEAQSQRDYELSTLAWIEASLFCLEVGQDPMLDTWTAEMSARQTYINKNFTSGEILESCPSRYCDVEFSQCAVQDHETYSAARYTCCSAVNPKTSCESPPCWFCGPKCPPINGGPPSFSAATSSARRLKAFESAMGRGRRLTDGRASPTGYASPLDPNVSRDLFILDMEQEEAPILKLVTAEYGEIAEAEKDAILDEYREELVYAAMPAGEAVEAREDKKIKVESFRMSLLALEREVSQIITRSAVLRDTICKQAISQMSNEPPMRFVTPGFTVWTGKSKNLSTVNGALIFPAKFAVPSSAPEEPTKGNPISSFSFIYLEYTKNIYGWSGSAPPGNKTQIITLIIMRASTTDYIVRDELEPIRVFADLALFSAALCMYWDRFAQDTAGGAWSVAGVMNDGDGGCVTTHLSDIGLFLDGRATKRYENELASSYFLEEIVDVGMNFSQMAILGLIMVLCLIWALWGFIRDELEREKRRLNNEMGKYHLNGDGLTSAKSVADPIAYKHAHKREVFLAMTLWGVIIRDHALISPLMFHEKFTRPQRVLVLSVMLTTVLAVNATIYGMPDRGLVSANQFVASGVISGLLAFPVFVLATLLFTARPFAAQKRLIKRSTDVRQFEAIAKVRKDTEAKSSLRQPPSYATGPAIAYMSRQDEHQVGGQTLLALPPPSLPGPSGGPLQGLPPPVPSAPLPPGLPGGALPSLPMLFSLPVGGFPALPALQGAPPGGPPRARGTLPSLPPLPKLTALPGTQSHPPPPPPKAPPRGTTSLGFAALPGPSTPGRYDGQSGYATPPMAMDDMEMSDSFPVALINDPMHRAAPPAEAEQAADAEAEAGAPRELRSDGQHQMMGGLPALPKMQGPPPKRPGASTPPPPPPLRMPVSGTTTPPWPLTPPGGPGHSLLPGRLDGTPSNSRFGTPRTPSMTAPPSTGGRSGRPMTPVGPPPLHPLASYTATGITRGIVHRGGPPIGMPPPFKAPGAAAKTGFNLPPPPPFAPPGQIGPRGVPAPPFMGQIPGGALPAAGGTNIFGMVPPPRPPPPPPPPPKEDDQTFLRRTRLQYMDRAARVHQEQLLSENQEVAWDAPEWAHTLTLFLPYAASSVSLMLNLFVIVVYGLKFGAKEENNFMMASIIGLGLVLVPLEVVRSAITTIVELRKFEIRRGLAGGEFLQSKIRSLGAGRTPLVLTEKKIAPKRPAMPEIAPKMPTKKSAPPTPPPAPAPPAPANNLPIAPPSPGASYGPGGFGGVPGPPLPRALPSGNTPTRSPSGSTRSGFGGPPSLGGSGRGGSLLPGRLDGTNTSLPPLGFGPGQVPPPPVPNSPVTSVTASLTEKLKASRVAAAGAPPPPGSPPGSRPSSHRMGAQGSRPNSAPKPPTPPPQGTMAQTRKQSRQQSAQKQA